MFYWLAISLGFVGSLHCMAMCGPVQTWLLGPGSKQGNFVLYHTGRVFSYALFGLSLGFFGLKTSVILSQNAFLIILLLLALIALFARIKGSFISTIVIRLHGKFNQFWQNQNLFPKWSRNLFLGSLNAFLPCGLVYGALILATAIASPLESMAFMALFGFGTVPALFFVHYLSSKISNYSFANTYLLPSLNIMVVAALIYKGLQSEGSQEMILKAASDIAAMCTF